MISVPGYRLGLLVLSSAKRPCLPRNFVSRGSKKGTALLAHKKVGGLEMKNLDSLMAAYLAVWAIFFVYHFTIARRVARLQDEIARLKQNLKQ